MGFLRRIMNNNGEEDDANICHLWLCEKELEAWFKEHPTRRLPQSLKKHLTSKYNVSDCELILASKRVRRRLHP
jgi:hypothetical protein